MKPFLKTTLKNNLKEIFRHRLFLLTLFIGITFVAFGYYLTSKYYGMLPDRIPFFYNMPWGTSQLAPSYFIFGPLLVSLLFLVMNSFFSMYSYKGNHIVTGNFIAVFTVFIISLSTFYTLRILYISSIVTIEIPLWIRLIPGPAFISFLVTLGVIPIVIKLAKRYGYMDDPLTHKHPAMLLTRPIPRAGGFAFYLGVLIPSFILLPITQSQKLIGIFLGGLICVITGLRDDKYDMSPYTRLLLEGLAVVITIMAGFILIYIPNPFGDALKLDDYKFTIDLLNKTRTIHYVSVIAAVIWMFVLMNFMSWANGTDGVYAGLVTITAAVIAIIMFRTALAGDPSMGYFIKLAAIISGAGLAMAIFTWPPNKLLWGFGATAPALMIAALSIIGGTKVAITFLILIIPCIDGLVAIVRRIKRKQLPFWGDREHLHHILLDRYGWTKQNIALFYWAATIIFGTLAVMTSGISRALTVGVIAIIVLVIIASLNLIKKPRIEKQSNKDK
jgi:UDP-GlcNAc:undecaprenyl-phosphate/decaprenyl-phosphate GlcNAc-1-phosphate transferase